MPTIDAAGRRIDYERIDAGASCRPPLVFLHEGLGSIAMWRDFPDRVAHATGCDALIYSRYGYGNSEALHEARSLRYMHDEALVALPELLDRLAIAEPILIGHSDGASIALIHAGCGKQRLAGVVAMAPHVIVEDISVASIAAAKRAYEATDLRARLARYHADVDSAFWGWNRIWLDPSFLDWSIEGCLPAVACPVLAIQGAEDEYGTMEQLRRIAAAVPDVDAVELADCGHSPHRDQPDATLQAIVRFIDRVAGGALRGTADAD